jgi:hypothetical protein
MVVNDAAVVREIAELYPRYERALVENDVTVLNEMFWRSPEAMRFGVNENLYGIEEIDAFRRERPGAGLERRVIRTDIVTFGKDYGSVTIEFERRVNGRTVYGRQSQVWVRMPEGWRIVAAHVSVLPG